MHRRSLIHDLQASAPVKRCLLRIMVSVKLMHHVGFGIITAGWVHSRFVAGHAVRDTGGRPAGGFGFKTEIEVDDATAHCNSRNSVCMACV